MQRSKLNIVSRLLVLVRPLQFKMIIAITMGVIGYCMATFITILASYVILHVLGFETLPMMHLLVSMIVIALLRGVLHYIEQYHNHYIAFKLLAIIRDRVFRSLRKLAPAKLDGKDSGQLISLITSDIELLEVFYAHTISPIFIASFTTLIMTIFISQFHILFGIILLIAHIIVGVIIPIYAGRTSLDDGAKYREQLGHLNGYYLDSIRGYREILQFHQTENRRQHILNLSKGIEKTNKNIHHTRNLFTTLTQATILLASVVMLVVSSSLYLNGEVSFNFVLIPVVTLLSSFGAVSALANLGVGLTQTFASANRVLDILDEHPLVNEIDDGTDVQFENLSIEKINFAYDRNPILQDFSYEIKKNRILGIHGKSGSGKSTLLKLMMRFWDIDSGKISINNVALNKINTSSLRNNQSLVTQTTHLFHDTIANNLRIAKFNATDEELIEACKKANIHEFISTLPDGYETMISELGANLSGGERQRIGVARAFLHAAPMILLDEPTSNLDSLNELVILKSLKQIQDKTIVLISHRSSTMNICDEVLHIESTRLS